MYLFKRSTNIKQKILNSLGDGKQDKEIAYWRKDWFIHGWFCENFGVENCEDVIISKEDLLALIKHIKENAEEDDKKEDWERDRKIDIKKLNKIIDETDWENEEIYYYAWW